MGAVRIAGARGAVGITGAGVGVGAGAGRGVITVSGGGDGGGDGALYSSSSLLSSSLILELSR